MIYFEYGILAVVTVILSVRLAVYVDALDKKTNLSGAFIGGVMLATVTSLPELFTSLTSVFVLDKPMLVQGNVLGSNIFNLMILGFLMLISHKKFKEAKIADSHQSSLLYILGMYVCVFIALRVSSDVNIMGFHIDLFSIVLLAIYTVSILRMNDDTSGDTEEEDTVDLSVRQVTIRFIVLAILLVAASILLTRVSDDMIEELQLGTTVGSAIFLGVATSLPELSTSISLVKINNLNAAVGNIVGSCLFNFAILCLTDILYINSGVHVFSKESAAFVAFGTAATLLTYTAIRHRKKDLGIQAFGFAIVVCYLCSIFLAV